MSEPKADFDGPSGFEPLIKAGIVLSAIAAAFLYAQQDYGSNGDIGFAIALLLLTVAAFTR